MRIVDGMVVMLVGDAWVAVPTGDATERLRGVVRLNETAKAVWDGIAEGLGEGEMAARFCDRYDIDEEHALASVRRTVETLVEAGVVDR